MYELSVLMRDPVELCNLSPQLALAVAEGVQLAPMTLACKATFSSTSPPDIASVSLENGQGATLSQASLITGISYQIDQPNAQSGSAFKSLYDYFYTEQSGISATLKVVGTPRYTVCEFYEPLRIVRDMANTRVQSGWVLNGTQSIQMAFHLDQSTQLTVPTTITFAFCMVQPAGTDKYIYLKDGAAIQELINLGVDLPAYIKARAS
jgi:hypothetical protein